MYIKRLYLNQFYRKLFEALSFWFLSQYVLSHFFRRLVRWADLSTESFSFFARSVYKYSRKHWDYESDNLSMKRSTPSTSTWSSVIQKTNRNITILFEPTIQVHVDQNKMRCKFYFWFLLLLVTFGNFFIEGTIFLRPYVQIKNCCTDCLYCVI